jgi:DNA-binding response OmpR family regulator
MKQVLIIDESPLFREYLRGKLEDNGVGASVGVNAIDGISKMRSIAPDLIILDYHLGGRHDFMDVLRQKKADPNSINIPVIIMAQRIDQKRLIELVPYNVKKIFTKPVKIDAFFAALSELLGIHFRIDESQGIVEVHVNDNIIFVEIAKGLNRDKLELLRFKITELIALYEIRVPKLIVMLSDIKLGFADTPNVQLLFETVTRSSRAKLRNIKVLTKDGFVHQFINAQKEYSEIEVVTNLALAVDGFAGEIGGNPDYPETEAELIGDRILKAKGRTDTEAMALKFDAEARNTSFELIKDSVQNLRIAVVDDDITVQEMVKNIFQKAGALVSAYSDGDEFLADLDTTEFDLAFLEINMPRVGGFEVLKTMQTRDIRYPVIAISSVVPRETVINAFRMGAKSYLVKPLEPDDLFRKSVEILKANF